MNISSRIHYFNFIYIFYEDLNHFQLNTYNIFILLENFHDSFYNCSNSKEKQEQISQINRCLQVDLFHICLL